MPCTRSEPRRWPRAALAAVALLGACALQPGTATPRPPLPVPAVALAAAPPLPEPVLERLQVGADGRHRGVLVGAGERVVFEWRHTAGNRRPTVLLVPILNGGQQLMDLVADRLEDLGFDVASCQRAGTALSLDQRGPEVEILFRRTVQQHRLLLAWLRRQPEPPPVVALGISMGGMLTTALLALEPDLAAGAICLGGGDLADLILQSAEPRVRRWVDFRQRVDGIGRDPLRAELRANLSLEPLAMAAAVDSRRVLLVSATFDTTVPTRHQDLLWEALGRPQRLFVPFGHYTAAIALDTILGAAADHFLARLTPAGPP